MKIPIGLTALVLGMVLMQPSAYGARVVLTAKVSDLQIMARTQIPGVNNPSTGLSFDVTGEGPPNIVEVAYPRFSITSQTVPDESLRAALISLVLVAYTAGKDITIGYESDGSLIDNRMYGIYYITVRD